MKNNGPPPITGLGLFFRANGNSLNHSAIDRGSTAPMNSWPLWIRKLGTHILSMVVTSAILIVAGSINNNRCFAYIKDPQLDAQQTVQDSRPPALPNLT